MSNHLKKYGAIYLILLLIISITLIIIFRPKNEETKEFDTSFFNVVNTKEAVDLFNSSKNQILFIGRPGCSACQKFVPYLKIAVAQNHITINYLNLDEIDRNSEEYQKLIEKLDFEYTLNDTKAKFGDFMGATPMFIIIKNNRMVYGYIGVMTHTRIAELLTQYGINE